MSETYELDGMIRVTFNSLLIDDFDEFETWVELSIVHKHFVGFSEMYFDDMQDAVLFALRWE